MSGPVQNLVISLGAMQCAFSLFLLSPFFLSATQQLILFCSYRLPLPSSLYFFFNRTLTSVSSPQPLVIAAGLAPNRNDTNVSTSVCPTRLYVRHVPVQPPPHPKIGARPLAPPLRRKPRLSILLNPQSGPPSSSFPPSNPSSDSDPLAQYASAHTDSLNPPPAVSSPSLQPAFTSFTPPVARRIPFDDPAVLTYVRIGYVAVQVIVLLTYYFVSLQVGFFVLLVSHSFSPTIHPPVPFCLPFESVWTRRRVGNSSPPAPHPVPSGRASDTRDGQRAHPLPLPSRAHPPTRSPQIKKTNDLTVLKYVEPPAPMSGADPKLVTTTVKDYDLAQASSGVRTRLAVFVRPRRFVLSFTFQVVVLLHSNIRSFTHPTNSFLPSHPFVLSVLSLVYHRSLFSLPPFSSLPLPSVPRRPTPKPAFSVPRARLLVSFLPLLARVWIRPSLGFLRTFFVRPSHALPPIPPSLCSAGPRPSPPRTASPHTLSLGGGCASGDAASP
jgi:hypothetical protein